MWLLAQVRSPAFFLGLAAICAAGSAVQPCLSLLVLLLFGLLFIRDLKVIFVALLLLLIVGARARAQISDYAAAHALAAELLHEPLRCAFEGQVRESPTLRLDGQKSTARLLLATSLLDCEGKKLSGRDILIRVSLEKPHSLGLDIDEFGRGDRLSMIAQLAPEREFRNQGLPSAWPRLARRGSLYSGKAIMSRLVERGGGPLRLIDAFRSHVRRRITESYHSKAQALGRALVLGENDLNQTDYHSFQQSGLMHLLAVSGTHLVIAVVGLMSLLRAFLTRISFLSRRWDVPRLVYAFGGFFSLVYADFSGGSGSARRAALMLTLISLWRVVGHKLSGLHALGISLVAGVLLWPLRGLDYSFLLSALATLGLLFIGQPVFRHLANRWQLGVVSRWLLGSVVATLSSTLPCLPLLCSMSGSLTLAALGGNIIAGPLGELVALPACLVHTLTSPWPALEAGLANLGSGALLGVRAVALWSGELRLGRFEVGYPGSARVVWCLILLMLWCFLKSWYSTKKRLALLMLAFALSHFWPDSLVHYRRHLKSALSLTVLDVGQGDALLLRRGEFSLLMDAGGYVLEQPDTGSRVVLPYLRAQGITHLNVIAASHDHPDHINGLLSVVENQSFDEFWWPGAKEPSVKMLEILQAVRKKNRTIRTAGSLCVDKSLQENWKLKVLWPCAVPEGLSQNDLSLVLHISAAKRSALLTGDIEQAAEEVLLNRVHQGPSNHFKADFLKLAHHGSHTSSTPAFLDYVDPRFAGASAGIRNRFGHPRRQTLDRLKERGVTFFDTIRDGSVTWSTDGEKEWITTVKSRLQRRRIPPTAK